MKIAVIGAAGVRTPLLVHGLAEIAERIALDDVALFDIDRERSEPIARVARAVAAHGGLRARLHMASTAAEAIEGAAVVISSVRVGGIQARIQDETIAIAHGLVGQETVGAGGFACALRNLTAMIGYARLMDRVAPRAVLVNFTNPVGIVSQALFQVAAVRVLGVCDTPLELFEGIAQALGREPAGLQFDYFGLNHLGWVRAIRAADGHDLLPAVLSSPELIRKSYRYDLFPPEFVQRLGVLPSEYLYYYYFPELAYQNIRKSGTSRGQSVERLNRELFRRLAEASDADLLRVYENYLRERNATYFSLEATAGKKRDEERPLYSQFSGYERIAVSLLEALASTTPKRIPLTVRNDGALADLEPGDSVELPCEVSDAGVVPAGPGRAPEMVRGLLVRVKEYERLVAKAALTHSREIALESLVRNPLVGSPQLATQVLEDYLKAFGDRLGLSAAS
jgi:6-phospho-beta-glucosidase